MACLPEACIVEEITVTAQRREARLQDTPISITAFTASAIDKLGVTNVEQLANLAPNVRFDFTAPVSGASDAAGVFIRGVGQADFALTTEAGVGTYVDGVYMSRSIGGVLDVLDIDRMEILRGPQGTLFGRNTIGGVINIVSAKPTDEFGGAGELELGSFSRRYLRGTLNIRTDTYIHVSYPNRRPLRRCRPGRIFREAAVRLTMETRIAKRCGSLRRMTRITISPQISPLMVSGFAKTMRRPCSSG